MPPLLSSLVDIEYESVCSHGKGEVLVFDLARLAEASMSILSLWPPSLCLLVVGKAVLVRHSGGDCVQSCSCCEGFDSI